MNFEATEQRQILSGGFFQILCASQNVQTLHIILLCLPILNLFFNLLMPVVTAFCMELELVDGPEFSAPGPDIFNDI